MENNKKDLKDVKKKVSSKIDWESAEKKEVHDYWMRVLAFSLIIVVCLTIYIFKERADEEKALKAKREAEEAEVVEVVTTTTKKRKSADDIIITTTTKATTTQATTEAPVQTTAPKTTKKPAVTTKPFVTTQPNVTTAPKVTTVPNGTGIVTTAPTKGEGGRGTRPAGVKPNVPDNPWQGCSGDDCNSEGMDPNGNIIGY